MAENCDVADKLDLARAMVQCQEMPSVKGVIQGAMVLQVSDLWLNIYTGVILMNILGLGFRKNVICGIQDSPPSQVGRIVEFTCAIFKEPP